MKKVILSICFLLTAATFVSAQQGGGGNMQERMAQMRQRLKDDVKLTDAQADSVMAIQQAFQPRTREIRMDQSMSDTDKQTKMKAINDERAKRFETALGKETAAKVEEFYSRMRQGGGGRPQQ
jgi:hypothetical protein